MLQQGPKPYHVEEGSQRPVLDDERAFRGGVCRDGQLQLLQLQSFTKPSQEEPPASFSIEYEVQNPLEEKNHALFSLPTAHWPKIPSFPTCQDEDLAKEVHKNSKDDPEDKATSTMEEELSTVSATCFSAAISVDIKAKGKSYYDSQQIPARKAGSEHQAATNADAPDAAAAVAAAAPHVVTFFDANPGARALTGSMSVDGPSFQLDGESAAEPSFCTLWPPTCSPLERPSLAAAGHADGILRSALTQPSSHQQKKGLLSVKIDEGPDSAATRYATTMPLRAADLKLSDEGPDSAATIYATTMPLRAADLKCYCIVNAAILICQHKAGTCTRRRAFSFAQPKFQNLAWSILTVAAPSLQLTPMQAMNAIMTSAFNDGISFLALVSNFMEPDMYENMICNHPAKEFLATSRAQFGNDILSLHSRTHSAATRIPHTVPTTQDSDSDNDEYSSVSPGFLYDEPEDDIPSNVSAGILYEDLQAEEWE